MHDSGMNGTRIWNFDAGLMSSATLQSDFALFYRSMVLEFREKKIRVVVKCLGILRALG